MKCGRMAGRISQPPCPCKPSDRCVFVSVRLYSYFLRICVCFCVCAGDISQPPCSMASLKWSTRSPFCLFVLGINRSCICICVSICICICIHLYLFVFLLASICVYLYLCLYLKTYGALHPVLLSLYLCFGLFQPLPFAGKLSLVILQFQTFEYCIIKELIWKNLKQTSKAGRCDSIIPR